jgi:predicted nucleic acid-binding protein
VLLDAGPLVGCLVRTDQWHLRCTQAWPDLVGRCVTTEAVLTEASHLVRRQGGHPALPLETLVSAGVPIFAIHLPLHHRCVDLMRRYSDLGMDYADATLVALGDAIGATGVFTTDHRGFAAYRGARGRPYELHPA